ncbi:MAG: hypothetical protein GX556_01320 [Fibrobacter sp.]|nr:hypothetical protein [Fibrobacter sp.]
MKFDLPGFNYLILPLLLLLSIQTNGQDTPIWQDLSPEFIDRKALIMRHYDKKLFSVLPDTLRSSSNLKSQTWVAVGKIVVPQGAVLTVPDGVKIYFEPEGLMLVEGTVKISGTEQSPALLSIIDKSEMYIAPRTERISWKGIKVAKSGKLIFKDVRISGSETGISSEGTCDSLLIENITFSDPGNVSVNYSDFSVQVSPDIPFSLSCPKPWARKMEQRGYRVASNWFFGETAGLALAGLIFSSAGYFIDQKVKTSSTHDVAQGYSNRATTCYNVSRGLFIGAGITLTPAVIFKILSKKKSAQGVSR